mgnify:CR=1 FL=1
MTANIEHGAQKTTKHLIFSVGESFFAIEALYVLGIIQIENIVPIPHMAPSILGITKLRGEIYTVMDLHTRLLSIPFHYECNPLAISIGYGKQRVCAVIDKVLFVTEIGSRDIKPLSSTTAGANKFATSYALMDGKYVQLLSVKNLLADN